MKMFSVRLPEPLIRKLDKKRRKLKISRSALVRQLLENGLESRIEPSLTLQGLRSELLSEIQKLDDKHRLTHRPAVGDRDIEEAKNTSPNQTSAPSTQRKNLIRIQGNTKRGTPPLNTSLSHVHQRESDAQPVVLEEPNPEPAKNSQRSDVASKGSVRSETVDTHPIEFEHAVNPSLENLSRSKMRADAHLMEGASNREHNEAKSLKDDRRRGRSQDPLLGLAIGAERRQAVRLNRVLKFKNWSKADLAKKLSKPELDLDAALAGQKDLASLRVEALLATWESEMQETHFEVPIVKRKS